MLFDGMKGPPSSREPFPMVAQSPAMGHLIDAVDRAVASSRVILRLIPLIAEHSRMELQSFFVSVMKNRLTGQEATIYEGVPSLNDFDMDDPTVMLFHQGDRIEKGIQERLLQRQYGTYVLAAVSMNATLLVQQGLWNETFRCGAAVPVMWPPWSARKRDHELLVRFMHARLPMRSRRRCPELDGSAMNYFLTRLFNGTDAVNKELNRGFQNYVDWEDDGPLTSAHLAGAQKRRSPSTRGDMRRQPSEPPQAS